jgi:3D (Asp-Asp-Asp) domain-containing protein
MKTKEKKKHDPFLLWGEYPHGWSMIKDSILCILLMGMLIGLLKQTDLASLMASKTTVITYDRVVSPVEASTDIPEPKAPQNAKLGEFSAYTASIEETDADPYTMASGKKVYEGAIANNCLDFGTKVKVNGKIKVVEDRMNSRYDCDHFDIFMKDKQTALEFGRQNISYEIIK